MIAFNPDGPLDENLEGVLCGWCPLITNIIRKRNHTIISISGSHCRHSDRNLCLEHPLHVGWQRAGSTFPAAVSVY